MNNFKIKIWDKYYKEMIYPSPSNDKYFRLSMNGKCYHLGLAFGDSEILLYSGLQDINGIDIYDGDIVEYIKGKCQIFFKNGGFWFRLGGRIEFLSKSFIRILKIKVIGNKFENSTR